MGDRRCTQLVILTTQKISQLQKKFFFNYDDKMADISGKKYTDAKVCTITVSIRELFWVRMHDVQEGLRVKFETENLTKDQIRKYKRREKELDQNCNAAFLYVCR